MGENTSFVNEGWISGVFEMAIKDPNINMTVLCAYNKGLTGKAESFTWYTYKENKKDEECLSDQQKKYFEKVIKEVSPDIIHIWGSEYPHALAMFRAAEACNCSEKVVVWLQGLISVCSQPYYFYAGMPTEAVRKETLYDKFVGTSMKRMQMNFSIRGKFEHELLNSVKYVIGRTEWDKQYVEFINPCINYYHCNETMRKVFYDGIWNLERCKRRTIFVSQASYSLKGFHLLLEALRILKAKYKDIKVLVSGYNIADLSSFKQKIKAKSYGLFLRKIIDTYSLNDSIDFVGRLDASRMKEAYLKSNIVVSCSSIENSSNTVSEAMLLGVPVVASKVGGIPSVLGVEKSLLYKWDDMYEMASCIDRAFSNDDLLLEISQREKERAKEMFNIENNYQNLIDIYMSIIDEVSLVNC